MHYPLIDRGLLADLRLAHAAFNTAMLLLLFYHGLLGVAIRSARLTNGPLPFDLIKRHRTMGPILVVMGILGFCAGIVLVFLDTGNLFKYPPHLFVGAAIIVLLITTFVLSRKIKAQDPRLRLPHFTIGIIILCLYLIEVFLGIGVLF